MKHPCALPQSEFAYNFIQKQGCYKVVTILSSEIAATHYMVPFTGNMPPIK